MNACKRASVDRRKPIDVVESPNLVTRGEGTVCSSPLPSLHGPSLLIKLFYVLKVLPSKIGLCTFFITNDHNCPSFQVGDEETTNAFSQQVGEILCHLTVTKKMAIEQLF